MFEFCRRRDRLEADGRKYSFKLNNQIIIGSGVSSLWRPNEGKPSIRKLDILQMS